MKYILLPLKIKFSEALEKNSRQKIRASVKKASKGIFLIEKKPLTNHFSLFFVWILFCNTNKCSVLQTFVNSFEINYIDVFFEKKQLFLSLSDVRSEKYENSFFHKAVPDWHLGDNANHSSFLNFLVENLERLFNQEKIYIDFLKSLLSQALWVAGK